MKIIRMNFISARNKKKVYAYAKQSIQKQNNKKKKNTGFSQYYEDRDVRMDFLFVHFFLLFFSATWYTLDTEKHGSLFKWDHYFNTWISNHQSFPQTNLWWSYWPLLLLSVDNIKWIQTGNCKNLIDPWGPNGVIKQRQGANNYIRKGCLYIMQFNSLTEMIFDFGLIL